MNIGPFSFIPDSVITSIVVISWFIALVLVQNVGNKTEDDAR